MAEKGILVSDAEFGESVACRDAVELDDQGNARIIQRVDVGEGKLPTPFRDPANLLRNGIGSDGADASNYFGEYGSGVDDNVLVVGDKSTLVVQVEAKDNTSGSVTIVPILLEDDELTMQGTLEPITFDFSTGGQRVKLDGGEYDNFFIAPMMSWSVLGAHKIGIAVLENTDAYLTLDIYGAVI